MVGITLRSVKGSKLTHAELDGNFTALTSEAIVVADADTRKFGGTYSWLSITPYVGMRVVQTDQFVGGMPTIEWVLNDASDVTADASWMGRPLTNELGNLVVDLRLADFTGITPPAYSIGHVGGDFRMGDGVTEGGVSTFATATQAEVDAGSITNKGISPARLRIRYDDTNDTLIMGDLSGNSRGAGACDIQSKRTAVTQVASGADSVALGVAATAAGMGNVAVGSSVEAYGFTGGTAIGNGSKAGFVGTSYFYNLSLGNGVHSLGQTSAAIGILCAANAYDSMIIDAGVAERTTFLSGSLIIKNSLFARNGNISCGENLTPLEKLHSAGNALITNTASLGAEKLNNPNFTGNANNWTLGADWSYTTNSVSKITDPVGAANTLSQASGSMASAPVIGEYYLVAITFADFKSSTSGVLGFLTMSLGGVTVSDFCGGAFGSAANFQGTNGTVRFIVKATSTAGLTITPSSASKARIKITNCSVKRIIGGDIQLLGGIKISEISGQSTSGVATLVGGTVTVATTKVTANSRIQLTGNVDGGTVGFHRVSARSAGTSFTITSSSASDTSQVAWTIIEPL